MEVNQPLISIIVPVYNAEKYISQCINSLCEQTYRHIEMICINDGSKDGSLRILSEYARQDPRVVIIDQTNQGVSAARNAGVQQASGEYVMFVDGDDWVEPSICQELLSMARNENADCVMCGYFKEFANRTDTEQTFKGTHIFRSKEEIDSNLRKKLFGLEGQALSRPEKGDGLSVCWRQLWRVEICKNIIFEDLAVIGTFEDGLFEIQAFGMCQTFVYIDRPLYHYRKDNENSITSTYRPNLTEQWSRLFLKIEKLALEDKNSQQLQSLLSNRIAVSIIGLGLNEISAQHSLWAKRRNIKQILSRKEYKAAYCRLDYSYFPIWWLVFFKMCKWQMPSVVLGLLLVIEKLRKGRK